MARTITYMSFEEFAKDVEGAFERVVQEHQTIFVEKDAGKIVVVQSAPALQPENVQYQPKKNTEEERQAFLQSAGGWKGLVDTDKLVKDIYDSRGIPSRPHVRL